ncbi:hypothetical protein [Pseudobutyrivibrio sp. MD2005]|uniref:hypothetical protein n=1 Tax=Pseudobutyrivibrio sp. MD2005 TaxID=1410616 RepID=UPI00047F0351|nr:hypothetical protein [Pseudobutyrivibrio sp. MD2005]
MGKVINFKSSLKVPSVQKLDLNDLDTVNGGGNGYPAGKNITCPACQNYNKKRFRTTGKTKPFLIFLTLYEWECLECSYTFFESYSKLN